MSTARHTPAGGATEPVSALLIRVSNPRWPAEDPDAPLPDAPVVPAQRAWARDPDTLWRVLDGLRRL